MADAALSAEAPAQCRVLHEVGEVGQAKLLDAKVLPARTATALRTRYILENYDPAKKQIMGLPATPAQPPSSAHADQFRDFREQWMPLRGNLMIGVSQTVGGDKTLDLPYMESVMWAFKTLWDKGLIYEGFRVLWYCWRCETPLLYYARTSWFIRTTEFKDAMLVRNSRVDWHPPEIGEGEGPAACRRERGTRSRR